MLAMTNPEAILPILNVHLNGYWGESWVFKSTDRPRRAHQPWRQARRERGGADVKAVGNLASTYARDLAAILKDVRDPGPCPELVEG